MRRREFIAIASTGIAWPLAARAQQSGKVARIGYLSPISPNAIAHLVKAFEQGLETLGYVHGRDIVIEYRWAYGIPERLHELAAELVQLKVDAIVTTTGPATAAAAKATATIPIVFVNVSGPVELGFIVSLARPGKNLTGLSYDAAPEAVAKSLEVLKEIAPAASRVAVMRYRGIGEFERFYEEVQRAARTLKLAIETYEVRDVNDIERALPRVIQQRPDALYVLPAALHFARRKEIADFAVRERLPAASVWAEFARAGGLFTFGPDIKVPHRRAASFVDKILKGAKPAELPVEQPTNFELVINLKTAKALGLTIPPSLLARADEVIE